MGGWGGTFIEEFLEFPFIVLVFWISRFSNTTRVSMEVSN